MTSLYDRVTGNALFLYSRAIQNTCRIQVVGIEHLHQAFDSERPMIGTSWHGKAFMVISCLIPRFDPSTFSGVIPDDWRGGTLAVLAGKLGIRPFPMNLFDDPTFGMGRQMVKLVRRIVAGENTFLAPDGPDGPAYVAKKGVSYIARKANAIIVPVGGYCRHAFRVNRWDNYVMPYPFSRVSIHVGEPISISPDEDDLDGFNQRLTDILHRVTAQAHANFYSHRPSWRRD
jgi:lysophospholipid acyltransferase (LPLAT)-like uncharacterized protein